MHFIKLRSFCWSLRCFLIFNLFVSLSYSEIQVISCGQAGKSLHSRYSPSRNWYENDELIEYECLQKYSVLIGPRERRCVGGKWTGRIPKCAFRVFSYMKLDNEEKRLIIKTNKSERIAVIELIVEAPTIEDITNLNISTVSINCSWKYEHISGNLNQVFGSLKCIVDNPIAINLFLLNEVILTWNSSLCEAKSACPIGARLYSLGGDKGDQCLIPDFPLFGIGKIIENSLKITKREVSTISPTISTLSSITQITDSTTPWLTTSIEIQATPLNKSEATLLNNVPITDINSFNMTSSTTKQTNNIVNATLSSLDTNTTQTLIYEKDKILTNSSELQTTTQGTTTLLNENTSQSSSSNQIITLSNFDKSEVTTETTTNFPNVDKIQILSNAKDTTLSTLDNMHITTQITTTLENVNTTQTSSSNENITLSSLGKLETTTETTNNLLNANAIKTLPTTDKTETTTKTTTNFLDVDKVQTLPNTENTTLSTLDNMHITTQITTTLVNKNTTQNSPSNENITSSYFNKLETTTGTTSNLVDAYTIQTLPIFNQSEAKPETTEVFLDYTFQTLPNKKVTIFLPNEVLNEKDTTSVGTEVSTSEKSQTTTQTATQITSQPTSQTSTQTTTQTTIQATTQNLLDNTTEIFMNNTDITLSSLTTQKTEETLKTTTETYSTTNKTILDSFFFTETPLIITTETSSEKSMQTNLLNEPLNSTETSLIEKSQNGFKGTTASVQQTFTTDSQNFNNYESKSSTKKMENLKKLLNKKENPIVVYYHCLSSNSMPSMILDQCDFNNDWNYTQLPNCTPPTFCDLPSNLPKNVQISSAIVFHDHFVIPGDFITFTCSNLYEQELIGVKTQKCTQFGNWSDLPPICSSIPLFKKFDFLVKMGIGGGTLGFIIFFVIFSCILMIRQKYRRGHMSQKLSLRNNFSYFVPDEQFQQDSLAMARRNFSVSINENLENNEERIPLKEEQFATISRRSCKMKSLALASSQISKYDSNQPEVIPSNMISNHFHYPSTNKLTQS